MAPSKSPESIRVSVYSDYTCPWCYVGAARLERLREELQGDVELIDTWMPFEIHPEVPDDGMPVEELPYSEEQFREMNRYLRKQAESEGLPVVDRATLANTHRALAAGTFVQDRHREYFPAFHHRLFGAYFGEGKNLNDMEVLREIAEEVGVPADAMEEVLLRGDYDDAIAATGEMARRLGITGTPTFVFENQYAIVGAHPVETLRSAVARILEKRNGNP